MKKGSEWLAMLPKEAQFKWLREMIHNDTKEMARYFLERDFTSMLEFILSTFLWEKSKDGMTYWGNIAYNEQYK
jgi:hypothetical protein